jgi:thymidylate synthase
MLVIEDTTVDRLFARLKALVRSDGIRVSPRGIPTIEVGSVTCVLTEPKRRILTSATRRINPAFMFADALYLLSGSSDDWIFDYNQRLRNFTDEGRLHGAYGPRLRSWCGVDQLSGIRDRFQQDPSSRRACIVLYDPARDLGEKKDIPCTVAMHFVARDAKLSATTFMRSQDLWLGFPYDVFNFTLLQEVVAESLGLRMGTYTHITSSLHLYERDLEKAARDGDGLDEEVASSYPTPWETFPSLMRRLVETASGRQQQVIGTPADDGWLTLELTLHAYRAWKRGDVDRARQVAQTLADPVRTLFARFTNIGV